MKLGTVLGGVKIFDIYSFAAYIHAKGAKPITFPTQELIYHQIKFHRNRRVTVGRRPLQIGTLAYNESP